MDIINLRKNYKSPSLLFKYGEKPLTLQFEKSSTNKDNLIKKGKANILRKD